MHAYNNNHQHNKALQLYHNYKNSAFPHDTYSHIHAIKACELSGNIIKGQQIHESLLEQHSEFEFPLNLKTTLIEFYGKSKQIDEA